MADALLEAQASYAFRILDYVAENRKITSLEPFLKEAKKEFTELVVKSIDHNDFWHDQYLALAKEIMVTAGLPDTFQNSGLNDALSKIRQKMAGIED